MLEDVFLPIAICGMLFIGVPWLIFHYVTQWKRNGSLTVEDERLMDELYETARRLEARVQTIERIMAADDPDFARRHPPQDAGVRFDKEEFRPAREREPARHDRDEDRRPRGY